MREGNITVLNLISPFFYVSSDKNEILDLIKEKKTQRKKDIIHIANMVSKYCAAYIELNTTTSEDKEVRLSLSPNEKTRINDACVYIAMNDEEDEEDYSVSPRSLFKAMKLGTICFEDQDDKGIYKTICLNSIACLSLVSKADRNCIKVQLSDGKVYYVYAVENKYAYRVLRFFAEEGDL